MGEGACSRKVSIFIAAGGPFCEFQKSKWCIAPSLPASDVVDSGSREGDRIVGFFATRRRGMCERARASALVVHARETIRHGAPRHEADIHRRQGWHPEDRQPAERQRAAGIKVALLSDLSAASPLIASDLL